MTLVAHWPLDEDSGDATDVTGNANTGSVVGATQGVTGILGTTAYSFDGSDDEITLSSGLVSASSDFTYSLWFKADRVDQDDPIIQFRGDVTSQVNNDNGTFELWDGPSWHGFGTVSTGIWTFITVVYDSSVGNQTFYRDGVKQGTAGDITSDSKTSRIMGSGDSTTHGKGDVDDVRVYDRALTPQEIQYLYWVAKENHYVSSKKVL